MVAGGSCLLYIGYGNEQVCLLAAHISSKQRPAFQKEETRANKFVLVLSKFLLLLNSSKFHKSNNSTNKQGIQSLLDHDSGC